MATKYAVETVFSMIDNFTSPLNKVGIKGKSVADMLKNQFEKAEKTVGAMKKKMIGLGGELLKKGVSEVKDFIKDSAMSYIEFDDAMHSAGAAFSDVDKNASDFEDTLKVIGKEARKVAAVTEFNALDTANAMSTMARAGVDSKAAISLLPGVADLATAAGVSLEDAVGMAVGGLNVMGMMSKDPEILAENMTRLSDVMAYTADSANMSLTDVSEAVKQGGNFFKTANNDLTTLSSGLTALANSQITGAEAGVSLRNIMTNLSIPRVQKQLAGLGIEVVDSSGDLLNLAEIVGQFETALDGMGDAEKNAILYQAFGKQNIAGFNALLNTGEEALRGYAKTADDSLGSAAAKAGAMRGSLKNSIEVLKSGLSELGMQFVESFADDGKVSIQSLTQAVQDFTTNSLPTVISITKAALSVIIALAKVVWALRVPIAIVTSAILLFKGVMIAAVLVTKIYDAALVAWTVVQWALNASLYGCPLVWIIGLVILAIGVVVGIIAAIKNWGKITEWFKGVLFAVGTSVLNIFAHIEEFFISFGSAVAEWLIGFGSMIIEVITNALSTIGTFVLNIFAHIEEFFISFTSMIWEGVLSFVEMIKNAIQPLVDFFMGFIGDVINGWQALVAVFQDQGLIGALAMIGKSIVSFILSPIESVLNLLSNIPVIGDTFAQWRDSVAAFRDELSYSGLDSTGPITERDAQRINTETFISESNSNANVTIGLERGLVAQVSGPAPGVTIEQYHSGGF